MVLGHSHRRQSAASPQKASPSRNSLSADDHDYNTEDETVVDAEQGNILGHIISQLRPGADLSRVTLPTFFLEPRSMLERITNFMAHPELLLPIPMIEDPVERFVAVTKFYLSGWHIKPPGVKKPLNPILGEIFTGYWDYSDGTRGYYISEQTSHHPPKSSYFFMAPEHFIRADGCLKPRSKFLGNSAASMMEGLAVMRFLNRNERYFITQPNMYARGILFGKMKYELGDHSFIRCPETGLMADLEFKTKGYFSGMYNAIGGFIKDTKTDKNLFELSGLWHGEMFIKNLSTGKKELLWDATGARETPPKARPIEEQDEIESQRLWGKVNVAIKQRDQTAATDEKSFIENAQREKAAKRLEDGVDWKPRLFRTVHGGPGGSEEGEEDLDFIINARVDGATPEEQVKQILNIYAILPGQRLDDQFAISARKSSEHVPTTNTGLPTDDTPQEQAKAHSPSPAPIYVPAQTLAPNSTLVPDETATTPQPASQPHPVPTYVAPPVNELHAEPTISTTTNQIQGDYQPFNEEKLTPTKSITSYIPEPESQLVESMNKLKVGDFKEQAAEPPKFDPNATPKAGPVQDGVIGNEVLSPTIQRMDSQTHEIDEFVDAEP